MTRSVSESVGTPSLTPNNKNVSVDEEKKINFLLRNVPAKRRDNFKQLKKARIIRSSMNDFIVDAFLAELEKYGG